MIGLHFKKMEDSVNEVFMGFVLISLKNLHVKLFWLVSGCILTGCSDDLFD